MKKENLGGIIMAGSILMAMLIILLHGLRTNLKGETHNVEATMPIVVPEVTLESPEMTIDSTMVLSNDAVFIYFTYEFTKKSKYHSLDIKGEIKELGLSQNYLYFKHLPLPYELSDGTIITNIKIDDRVEDRDKFINVLIDELDKDGWEISVEDVKIRYTKGNLEIRVFTFPYNFITTKLTHNKVNVELSDREANIISNIVIKKHDEYMANKDRIIRENFIEEFDTK